MEEKNQKVAAEATVVKLFMTQPFIQKLDASLATLTFITFKQSNRQDLKLARTLYLSLTRACLRILSLGRNNIKKIEGLEAVADTLEELWISYNVLEKINGIECCKKLKVLYVSNNKIKGWDGIQTLPALDDFLAVGNPLEEKCTSESTWIPEITKRFPQIKKLDGKPLIRTDQAVEEEAK